MNHKELRLTPQQANVLELYQQDRNVVNFDPLLHFRYWVVFDGWDETKPTLENMAKSTSTASINRARRKLHEYGLILYSKEASKRREKRYKEMTEEHSNFITRFFKGVN